MSCNINAGCDVTVPKNAYKKPIKMGDIEHMVLLSSQKLVASTY